MKKCIFLKKNHLVKKYKKQMCCKKNNRHEKSPKFCHFQNDSRFLFSREIGNIRNCKEVRLEKIVKFRLSGNSIRFGNFQVA